MITRLEYTHSCNIIHRDIKPANFTMGIEENKDTVFIIDFGNSIEYQTYRNESREKGIIGTARYASINNHLGGSQSRKDDMESLAYMLIYFLEGRLPW